MLTDNKNISVNVASDKLALLLAVTPGTKSSEICNLDPKYVVKTGSKYIFMFDKLSKAWRKGKPP